MDLKIVGLFVACFLCIAFAQDGETEGEGGANGEGGPPDCPCGPHGKGPHGKGGHHWHHGKRKHVFPSPFTGCDDFHKAIYETMKSKFFFNPLITMSLI